MLNGCPAAILQSNHSHADAFVTHLNSSRKRKTLVVLVIAILANGAGNLCISYGMKTIGAPSVWTPHSIVALVRQAFSSQAVLLGMPLLIVFFFLFLSLLSWADLSFVLPMISYCFVVNAFLARIVLGEKISFVRWTGILLVSAGVFLVSKTTTSKPPGEHAP